MQSSKLADNRNLLQSLRINPNSLQFLNVTDWNPVLFTFAMLKSQFINLHSMKLNSERFEFGNEQWVKWQFSISPLAISKSENAIPTKFFPSVYPLFILFYASILKAS